MADTPDPAAVETVMRVQQDHRLFASGLHVDCICKATFDMWVMARAHVAREVVAALDLDARTRAAEKRGAVKASRRAARELERALKAADAPEDAMATEDDLLRYDGRAEAVAIVREMLGGGNDAE